MQNWKLDFEQEETLTRILSGRNVFLTGRAGTGKTAVLEEFRKIAGKNTAFLAPTGLAALNLGHGASTIHRFFGLPACPLPRDPELFLSRQLIEKVRAVRTLVLDEISMISGELFWMIEQLCRLAAPPGKRDLPFGGIQVVAVGDPFQLPPVVKNYEQETYLIAHYGGIHAFDTWPWQEAKFDYCVLNNVHRQVDPVYVAILDKLRYGRCIENFEAAEEGLEMFNDLVTIASPLHDVPTLCLRNARVHKINEFLDQRLKQPLHEFRAQISGRFSPEDYPTSLILGLRRGSRVMLVANKYADTEGSALEYANGDLGRIVDIDMDLPLARVELDDGRIANIEQKEWLNSDYVPTVDPESGEIVLEHKVLGSFTALPLMLASAMSVHKAQGKSLSEMHLDFGRPAFASGQIYTALSRGRSLANLTINRPLCTKDLIVDKSVRRFGRHIEKAAAEAARRFAMMV